MVPGEPATWQADHAGMLGLSRGSHGVRVSLTFNLAGSMAYRLERLQGDLASLTVRALKVTGARGGIEAHAVVDLSASYRKAGAQQRAWSFDLGRGSSRLALSRALKGQLPGALLPSIPATEASALKLFAELGEHELPVGVSCLGSEFQRDTQLHVAASSFRMPDLLGASSLSASVSYTSSLAGQTQEGQTTLTLSHGSFRSYELLTLGSVSSSASAALVSALSIGPGGQTVLRPTHMEISLTHETANSGAFGRRRVAERFSRDAQATYNLAEVRPTSKYTAQSVRTLSLPSLQAIGQVSHEELKELAKTYSLPEAALRDVRDAVGDAAVRGEQQDFRRALDVIASHPQHGIKALHFLGGAQGQGKRLQHSTENERHDRLLAKFQVLETWLLSAPDAKSLARALKKLDKLSFETWQASAELRGDPIAAESGGLPIKEKAQVLTSLQREIDLLVLVGSQALEVAKTR